MKSRLACLVLALCIELLPLAATAQNITIQGKTFYKDGKPWVPKGIDVEAVNRPLGNYESAAGQANANQLRAWWGPAELDALKNNFGADVIRITVSQPGLDPQSPIYSSAYMSELLTAFKLARSHEFAVIVSMDAQAENGIPNLPGMPNDSTVRAWQTLVPPLVHDQRIMLELFNEPSRANWGEARTEWAKEMQTSIDAVRKMSSSTALYGSPGLSGPHRFEEPRPS